jgi:hypothetical protein
MGVTVAPPLRAVAASREITDIIEWENERASERDTAIRS